MTMAAPTKLTRAAPAVLRHWYSLHGELASSEGADVTSARGLPLVARIAGERPRTANAANLAAASSPADNAAQADYWNRVGARRWIDNRTFLTSCFGRSPLALWRRRWLKPANV